MNKNCFYRFLVLFLTLFIFQVSNNYALGNSKCLHGELLFAGEFNRDCLKYISMAPGQGIDGGSALRLTPDPWHNPTIRFHCGNSSRKDFSGFSELEFYFSSLSPDPGEPTVQLKTWNHKSKTVRIRDYISDHTIDKTLRLVKIPLSEFKTDEWDLGDVESIEWNVDRDRRTYLVDRIKLSLTTLPFIHTDGEWGPFPETSDVIRLTFSRRWLEKSVRNPENYTISSDSDPAYKTPSHPAELGIQFRVHGFTPSKIPLIRYSIFVRLPFPMKNGCTYRLNMKGIEDEFCNQIAATELLLTYEDRAISNHNIKVNQEGYLPEARKTGYVGGYFGDLGGSAWAVGERGTLLKWTSSSGWRKILAPGAINLRAVSGLKDSDVYFMGDKGEILHWNGSELSRIESPTRENLHGIGFGPQGDAWAVGANGITLRKNEGKWALIPTGLNVTLNGIWVGSGDSAWAVGDSGVILRWNGKKWVEERSGVRVNLHAIGGGDSDQLWVVGENGVVLVRSQGKWKTFPVPTGLKETLRCMSVDPVGSVWVAGDDGSIWHKPGNSSEFRNSLAPSGHSIRGITRQNARRFWAAGSNGTLLTLSPETASWISVEHPGSPDLSGLFSIPYGPMRLAEPIPEVTILDVETGKTVLRVPLKLEAANWNLSGEDVYSFDFSSIKTPGRYHAYIPGIGVSTPIIVSEDALNKAAYATAHAFYYQRCGTPLVEPYAEKDFTRPLDHEFDPKGRMLDAVFYESLPQSPLHAGEKPGEMINASGGWHDAGDYGKYMPTAAAALWYLFTGYDIQPSKFQDGAWNIPESGNGVPDLLDEARWELDWIARIQAADGSVHHKQTSEKWFHGMPQEENTPRYLFDKTTHDTALAAAVMASGARLWKPYDSKLANEYLKRAEKAWAFLETHPDAVPKEGFRNPPKNVTGEYRDKEDIDNRLWAACELYRTTGLPKYRDYFESWWRKNKSHPWGWNTWQDFYRNAYWAYLNSGQPNTDSSISREIRRGLLEKADRLIGYTNQNPYRNAARLNVLDWIGWGAFTQSSEYSFLLLQAWKISGDRKYQEMALLNLDTQLGANPLSMSFITGLGYRSPKDPLHIPSMYDGIERPFPGLPIFGPTAHLPNNQPFYVASQNDSNSYPPSKETLDPYPILRRYIDANQLVPMSEFTIVELAACAAAINLLAEKPDGSAFMNSPVLSP